MSSILAWWHSISKREQQLVLICLVFSLVGGLYWGVVSPLNQRADSAMQRIQSEKQLLGWVKNKADTIMTLRGSGGAAPSASSQPLNQVVSTTSRRFKVDLIRMQPRGDSLQVWIQPVPFNQLVNWLAFMREQQGLEVEFLDISRTDTDGMVEVSRLQLKRGG